jgi:hypothetical protein
LRHKKLPLCQILDKNFYRFGRDLFNRKGAKENHKERKEKILCFGSEARTKGWFKKEYLKSLNFWMETIFSFK